MSSIRKYLILGLALFSFNISNGALALQDDNSSKTTEVIQKDKEDSKAEGRVLSLADCIDIALDNNLNVAIAKERVKGAVSQKGQAKSDYFPSLNLSGGYDGNKISRPSTSSNGFSTNAGVKQLIYNFGKTGAKINSKKFNVISAEFDLDNTVLDTVSKVKTAYYTILSAKAAKEVQEDYVDINERQYAMTKAFFEEGLKSKIDLVSAEATLSEAKISLVSAKNEYQRAIISLNEAMFSKYNEVGAIKGVKEESVSTEIFGKDLTTDEVTLPDFKEGEPYSLSIEKKELLSDYILKDFPYTFEECLNMALDNRPDYKSYQALQSAAEETLKYTKRSYYPEVYGSAGWGLTDTDKSSLRNSFNYGASLDIPIGNVMNTKYKVDEVKSQLKIAEHETEKLKAQIYTDIEYAYADMLQLKKRIPLLEVTVKSTREEMELAEGRYQVGLGNYIELQDSKVAYNKAQLAYIKAVHDYSISKVKLETLMGLVDEINPATTSYKDKKL